MVARACVEDYVLSSNEQIEAQTFVEQPETVRSVVAKGVTLSTCSHGVMRGRLETSRNLVDPLMILILSKFVNQFALRRFRMCGMVKSALAIGKLFY